MTNKELAAKLRKHGFEVDITDLRYDIKGTKNFSGPIEEFRSLAFAILGGKNVLNGVKLRENEYLKDCTKSTLNMMLGENGMPRYTVDELKEVARQDMLDEVFILFEASNLPTKPKGTNGKRGAKPKPSKDENSARVKKCNLIRDLANGSKTLDDIKDMYNNDYYLMKVCKWEELVKAATTKTRPLVKGKFVNVTLDNGDYIVAKADGIYAE